MKTMTWTSAGRAAAAALLAAAAPGCRQAVETPAAPPLLIHVGGTMRPVFQELAKRYVAAGGDPVEINAAGSGELLARIENAKEGDLYVCHDPFLDSLMIRGLGVDGWTVAQVTPTILVAKGNPKGVRSLAYLARPDVSVVLTDPDYSTLGHMLPAMFQRAGVDLAALQARPTFRTFREGGQAANVVKAGEADATIVWNAVAHLRRDELDAVAIPADHLPRPDVDAITSATNRRYDIGRIRVTIATLNCSRRPDAARAFAEFAASPEASSVFAQFGFTETAPVREYRDGRAVGRAPAQAAPGPAAP